MASFPISRSDFYVYALLRGDCTPFYIGMGVGDRWLEHEKFVNAKNTHKNNVIRKMLRDGWPEVPKVRLAIGLTRPEAAQIERDMIALIGRNPNGPLTNKTGGGEGLWDPDEETRQKMREARKHFVFTEETRAKLSAAGKGRKYGPRSAEHRAKLSAGMAGKGHTEKTRKKMSISHKARPWTPERQAQVLAARNAYEKAAIAMPSFAGMTHSPETRQKISDSRKDFRHTEESKRKIGRAHIGRKHTAKAIENMKKGQAVRSVEWSEKMREAAKERWANPAFRARIAAKWTAEKRALVGRQSKERALKRRDQYEDALSPNQTPPMPPKR